MQPGQILFLNGPSSAGKSSIANALQKILNVPYLNLSIDTFFEAMCQWYDFTNPHEWKTRNLPHHRTALYKCAALFSSCGHNVLVDTSVHAHQLTQWAQLYAPLPAHFIGVFCELDELIRREHQRGMDRIDQIKGQVEIIHEHGQYDLIVDSSHKSPVECAECILQYLQDKPVPSAFQKLSEKMP